MTNTGLLSANKSKKDEFYTQLSDIKKELIYYTDFFKDKIVFCNCDDPYESNFFKYFATNFHVLGLKRLITTCYAGSSLAYSDPDVLPLFQKQANRNAKKPYSTDITSSMFLTNNHHEIDLGIIKKILEEDRDALSILSGDGDFRSEEAIERLIESDVVVTNPPFSLFREFIAQLEKYHKKFLVIGNVNALSYQEIFPLIKENRLWLGKSIHSGDREFRVPDDYPLEAAGCRIGNDGKKYIRVKGVRWFTNIDYPERYQTLNLTAKYSPEKYPKYDNYPAVNVDKVSDIPCDYDGEMGVPITFLDKYNPQQFAIIGMMASTQKTQYNFGYPYLHGKKKYARIIIKRKLHAK